MKRLLVIIILCWLSLHQAGATQCMILQERMSILTRPTPSFLRKKNTAKCQVYGGGQGMLRCGRSDVYIKPECVCTFHNVYEAMHHRYSSRPHGEESDVVTQLKCPDCLMYSLENNGPCINGGNLTCKGNEVGPQITCDENL